MNLRNQYFGNQPRTPNGDADLLSNDPPPSSSFPPRLDANMMLSGVVEEDELPPRSGDSEIYKRLDSFEEKLESELQDLEAFGVNSGADPTRKRLDPDGKGERPLSSSVSTATTESSNSSSSSSASKNNIVIRGVDTSGHIPLEKGNGKSGKKLTKLSHKTTKIMSDYQAYLAEIQTGYPRSFDSMSSEEETAAVESMQEDLENPALLNIAHVRSNLKDSYLEREQEKKQEPDAKEMGGMGTGNGMEPSREDGRYATGEGHPLYRVWSDDGPSGSVPTSPASSTHGGYDYATVFGESLLARSSESCGQRRYRNAQSSLPRWMRQRRVQRGLGMVVLACIIIGISVGVANIKKQENLPNWEAEYEAEVEIEEEKKLEQQQELAKMEMEEEIKMQPPLSQKGNLGFDDKLAQMEKEKEQGEKEMMKEHSAAPALPMAAPVIVEEAPAEKQMMEEHSAVSTPMTAPEIMEEVPAEDSIAVSNNSDTTGPDSGLSEEEKEKGFGEQLAMDLYYNAVVKYRPTMYDRSKGWKGTTYVEALVFCDSQGGLAVCPYEAVCPNGSSGEPMGGYREGPHGDWAWIPIVDDYNEWVQGSAREKCAKYSQRNGEKPIWGTTGKDDEGNDVEDLTQNIMCCLNVM